MKYLFTVLFLFFSVSFPDVLIPMDKTQSDHLKAYGVIFRAVKRGEKCYWLLNYRGGSFISSGSSEFKTDLISNGVSMENVDAGRYAEIMETIKSSNMEKIALEKAPKIAVYTPPGKLPWDDAVTLALTYAGIKYTPIYDKDVLSGELKKYDWLHLHHEDFTGQYSKFFASYGRSAWFQREKARLEKLSSSLGFTSVPECKKAVALSIKKYVEQGGFLFAMCSSTNTLDIALAVLGTDIVESPFDGDGVDPDYRSKLNFNNTFAFENFTLNTSAYASSFGNIDYNQVNTSHRKEAEDFILFDFSAKLDPVPAMLNQSHVKVIKGFFGLLTSFNRDVIKKDVIILGYTPNTKSVRYIHGVRGKGQFTFLGGHDPEDYAHMVGDRHTMLELHKNSPGYRLILNNVLFPAAEKKEKKT